MIALKSVLTPTILNRIVGVIFFTLTLFAQAVAEETSDKETIVPYAPAVIMKRVEWWGPNNYGQMTWWAGVDQTLYPASLGVIERAPLVGKQKIKWLGRDYDIQKVVRKDNGSLVVTFQSENLSIWKLVMAKNHEGFWQVDVFPPNDRFVTARFRTVYKATKHEDGQP
jgi:hypothetical protein